jgi:hypothetical protein
MHFFNFALILATLSAHNIAEWCSFLQATTPILQKCFSPLGHLMRKQINSIVMRENHEPCFFMMTYLHDIDSKSFTGQGYSIYLVSRCSVLLSQQGKHFGPSSSAFS